MISTLLAMFLAFQVTPELRQHVEAGLKARSAGDADGAIREFRRVVELAPELPAAYVNLGAAYLDKKDYADAIPPLRKALELSANLPGAHGMLGSALLAQGYAAEAVPHLEKAQADDLLGVALLESGRPREAADRLEAASQKRPDDPDLMYYLGVAHSQIAKEFFERLRSKYPDSPHTQQMLGDELAAMGNRDGAIKRLRAAIAARRDLHGVHLAIGELLLESGDYEGAEREFRAEAELAPGSAAAWYKLGVVLMNRGQTRAAVEELRRANTLQPDMPETLVDLGKTIAPTEPAEAEKLFRRVLELESDSKLAETSHYQLAQIYRKQGRTADAERETKAFQEMRGRKRE
jgi:tetratricopeptide (TPR) repeat protein